MYKTYCIHFLASLNTNTEKETILQADIKPIINGLETTSSSISIQPTPIPGTVPALPTTNGTESGLPIATTAEEIKERCPPKAMVKPQVLTHVIEDFVIQESSEPFPITRSSLHDMKPIPSPIDKDNSDEPSSKYLIFFQLLLFKFGVIYLKNLILLGKRHAGSPATLSQKGDLAKCEACGTVDLRAKFKKNKRFCSMACSKK